MILFVIYVGICTVILYILHKINQDGFPYGEEGKYTRLTMTEIIICALLSPPLGIVYLVTDEDYVDNILNKYIIRERKEEELF